MAKTAKLKKKQAAPHSRAARRAASPSLPIALPKDPKRSPSPSRPSETKHHVLSAQSAGISKKRNTKLTRAQRVRAEKAMERAADDMDKWELKKKKSIEKAGMMKGRAKMWEEVNGESVRGKKGGEKSAFAVLAEGGEAEGRKGSRWVGDEEMGDANGGGEETSGVAGAADGVAPPAEEDELL
ncbi:hypothetical protein SVAN01_03655 [Stagonosporopsis vannaccii]|nr:hypothetical protein SVAN01_03655 [Stagonosporopsis vannaccii]